MLADQLPDIKFHIAKFLEQQELSRLIRTSTQFGLLKHTLLHRGMKATGYPMQRASFIGDLNLVSRVLDEDDRVSRGNNGVKMWIPHYERALLEASAHGYADIVQLLLERLPELNADTTARGLTAVCLAASDGHADVLRVLLGSGRANPDWIDRTGKTPLHMAVERNQTEAIDILLQHGANALFEDGNGMLPFSCAARLGCLASMRLFAAHNSLLITATDLNKRRWTAMHHAANSGKLDAVEALAALGADLGARDGANDTPLALAVEQCHAAVVRFLLQKPDIKAEMQFPTSGGQLMLIVAVRSNIDQGKTVRVLLEAGADPNSIDRVTGDSALAIAVLKSNTRLMKLLMEAGANANMRDRVPNLRELDFDLGVGFRVGGTPAATAAVPGQGSDMLLGNLLEYENPHAPVDLNAVESDCSPLACAIRTGNEQAVDDLIDMGSERVDLNMTYTIPWEQVALMSREEAATVQTKTLGPALFIAIQCREVEIFKLLLDAEDIDLTVRDHWGRSLATAAFIRELQPIRPSSFEEMGLEDALRAVGVTLDASDRARILEEISWRGEPMQITNEES